MLLDDPIKRGMQVQMQVFNLRPHQNNLDLVKIDLPLTRLRDKPIALRVAKELFALETLLLRLRGVSGKVGRRCF